ncbi:MAG: transcriptional regulator [Mycobacterium sp.]|nr:transcriptional regulator [Mycobacterium sp.]
MPSVDPRWGHEMRATRKDRGLTLRALGALTAYSHTYLWEIETGRKVPLPPVATRVDEALQAGGRLVALLDEAPVTPEDVDRLAGVAAHPRSLDASSVESLRTILAHHRRLEDSIGSRALVEPALAHLRVVEDIVTDARGALRVQVVDVAAQWAQFAGWLRAASGEPVRARELYGRVLEFAAEAADPQLTATALSLRGHLAWQARHVGAVIELSAAALRQRASPGVRAIAAQQQARGYALAGEGDQAERKLDQAAALTAIAAEHPDHEPPWIYFYNGDYLTMQRGLAYRLLGRRAAAIEQLLAGVAAMPTTTRRSEWVGTYVLELALSFEADGQPADAQRWLEEARAIVVATGSQRLDRQAELLARRLRM